MHNKPLAGIRVIDLTQIYQGPYASFLMATAGAEVIKVEPPGGERLRGTGGKQTPLSFAVLNSNKKSITLNLKQPRGKDLLIALVEQADVLLENYAPGTLDRLGLGWDTLQKINPRLIYGSGTGYGLSGPDKDQLAMDHTIQAASGIMSMTGDPDRAPARSGGAPCDIMGGIHMYGGVMTALVGRGSSGKGSRVEVSMLEAMYFTLSSEFAAYHASGELPERASGRSPAGACPYGRYRCTDGWIAIICVSEGHWQNICKVIGQTELADHPDFNTAPLRKKREDEVDQLLNNWCAHLSRNEAFEQMRKGKIPVAPVKDLEEVRTDPHLHARGMLRWMTHPEIGQVVMPNTPIRYSNYADNEIEFYPQAGQHNEEIYGELLNVTDTELQALRHQQVI